MSAWIISTSVVSPLGFTSQENYAKISQQISGLSEVMDVTLSAGPVFAGQVKGLDESSTHTRFESMCSKAAAVALRNLTLDADRTLYILSTTKGNIELLQSGRYDSEKIHLHSTASLLAESIGLKHSMVVSNACISGVLAIIVAKRYLDAGRYNHCVIVGADVLSRFVISGFESLGALSGVACRPFDSERNGINLGEAAACIVLSSEPGLFDKKSSIKITGGGLSNDANHISGPSRTGLELAMAIRDSLDQSETTAEEVDFISAHGTATMFNDEMESKAFQHVGMQETLLHSLKGYFGHTLGAAGIVESVMCVESLLHDEVLASKGFENNGVSHPLNVSRKLLRGPITTCLKTASGFGGCNAAIVIKKY